MGNTGRLTRSQRWVDSEVHSGGRIPRWQTRKKQFKRASIRFGVALTSSCGKCLCCSCHIAGRVRRGGPVPFAMTAMDKQVEHTGVSPDSDYNGHDNRRTQQGTLRRNAKHKWEARMCRILIPWGLRRSRGRVSNNGQTSTTIRQCCEIKPKHGCPLRDQLDPTWVRVLRTATVAALRLTAGHLQGISWTGCGSALRRQDFGIRNLERAECLSPGCRSLIPTFTPQLLTG